MSRTYATRGEYGKAMQYAELAVTDNPSDTNLRGNLGVMYYRNSYWPEAVKELSMLLKAEPQKRGSQWKQCPSSLTLRALLSTTSHTH